jgi:hypothetical protein
MLFQSWRKLPDLEEDDFQGIPNEEISKSEILDMVCAMRSFENIDKDNVVEWLQSNARDLGFQHMTDTHIVNAAVKQKEEECGEDESDEGESSEFVSHSMALQCVDNLLDCMGQKGFECSDIRATRNIFTAMRRSLNSSQKEVTITNHFSK